MSDNSIFKNQYELENVTRDPTDDRDYIFGNTSFRSSNYDLVNYVREIEQQGEIGSCVGNAGVSALELACYKDGVHVNLSRLFAYYNVRMVDNRIGMEGAFLRSLFKSINQFGLPTEEQYPYITENQNIKPSPEIYDLAQQFTVTKYERVHLFNKESVKGAIDDGLPIVFGMDIKEDFYYLPQQLDADAYKAIGQSLGGHAMVIVGYDEKGVIIENSWGREWGDQGLGAVSWDILDRDGMDGWVATEIKRAGVEPQPEPEPVTPEPMPQPEPITPEPQPPKPGPGPRPPQPQPVYPEGDGIMHIVGPAVLAGIVIIGLILLFT